MLAGRLQKFSYESSIFSLKENQQKTHQVFDNFQMKYFKHKLILVQFILALSMNTALAEELSDYVYWKDQQIAQLEELTWKLVRVKSWKKQKIYIVNQLTEIIHA